MVKVLESDPKIAAATCKQIPRSDADLFACFGLWQHYFYTLDAGLDQICQTDADFDTLPGEEKRRLAGLDDVSCLIKKDIFEKFRFRKIQSSEDLDLGKRLIKAGYKNAFFFSIGVIHSHNRDPRLFPETLIRGYKNRSQYHRISDTGNIQRLYIIRDFGFCYYFIQFSKSGN